MIPDLNDEHDDELELPPLQSLDEDEEVGVGDLGFDLDVGDDETVGLDDSEGIEDFDPCSLLTLGGDEDGLLDNESAGDDIAKLGSDLDTAQSEYGWTDDSAADPSLFEGDDPLVDELDAWTPDDRGEEGTEEGSLLTFRGDDEIVGLPPLRLDDDDEEATADDLDLEDDALVGLAALSFEDEVRLMGSELPPLDDVPTHTLATGVVYDLCIDDEGSVWLAGDDLRRLKAAVMHTPAAEGLDLEDLLSVAVMPGSSGMTVVVGTRLGGVFRSLDGGETFCAINGWRSGREPSVGSHVAFDHAGRLWTWAGGALHRSRDLGHRWAGPVLPSPVLDVTMDDGRIVVLCASGTQLEVLRCRDDGLAFESVALPCSRGEATPRLAVSGEHVAIAHEGDIQGPWAWQGQRWVRVPDLSGVHLPIWIEGRLHGALHITGSDRGVLVRAEPPAMLVDLSAVFGDTPARLREVGADQRIHVLHQAGGVLWVGCGMGLVQISKFEDE